MMYARTCQHYENPQLQSSRLVVEGIPPRSTNTNAEVGKLGNRRERGKRARAQGPHCHLKPSPKRGQMRPSKGQSLGVANFEQGVFR